MHAFFHRNRKGPSSEKRICHYPRFAAREHTWLVMLCLTFGALGLSSCSDSSAINSTQQTDVELAGHYTGEKHRGAHVFGYLDSVNVQPILDCNIEWISMVPWAAQSDFGSVDLGFHKIIQKGIL